MAQVIQNSPVARLGFWAAATAAGASVVFCGAAVLIQLNLLSPPWNVIGSLVPSLILAPAFLVLLVYVHSTTTDEKKIWSRLAVAFAGAYMPLVSAAYVVEIVAVEPLVMRGRANAVALLTLSSKESVLNAIDGLGYCFMCLATLFLAPVFSGDRLKQWLRALLFANAVLVVPIVLTYFVNRVFIYAAALWAVTIPVSCILLAVLFQRQERVARGVTGERRAPPWKAAPEAR